MVVANILMFDSISCVISLIKEGKVKLVYCGTKDQVADIMTKPLKLDAFVKLRELLGVCEVPNLN